jgi:hypothetical protein
MSDEPYYVQCVSGNPDHIMEVVPGSELEERCKKRAEAGYQDALYLGHDECHECVVESRDREHSFFEYILDFGCPMADFTGTCEDECSCKTPVKTADSPYAEQVRAINPYT